MESRSTRRHSHRKSFIRLLIAGSALTLAAWSCSGDIGSTFDPTGPCATVYSGLCGSTCGVDEDCPAGLHCNDGLCDATCVEGDARCGDDKCNERGRCVDSAGNTGGSTGTLNLTGAGGAGGDATTSGMGGNCGSLDLELEATIPTVVLLIDQSGSMDADFNGQGRRWNVVYDALMNPTDGVVTQLQEYVRFGLALYTYEPNAPGSCPQIVDVLPPALNNHPTIDMSYDPDDWKNNTPTGDSINAITPGLVAFAEPGPKLIVLATDGDPDRCDDPNGHDQISKDLATDAAQAAFAQGIETVIIAVGNQVSQTHQQDMANAGSGRPVPAPDPCDQVNDPTNCAPTYEPTTKQDLIDTFTAVVLGQRDCVFTLNGDVVQGKECDGTVTLNGVELPCNDPDGWHLNGTDEIEFDGAACAAILSELDVQISANFPCDSILNPPQ